jgi:hypothetical protein
MTDLSPAAQAVLAALTQRAYGLDPADIPNEAGRMGCVAAAALRAVAHSIQMEKPLGDTDADAGVFAAHHAILAHILAIAADLEGTQ